MSSPVYRFVVHHKNSQDPRAVHLCRDSRALGFIEIDSFEYHDVYYLQGKLTPAERARLANELLTGSFMQEGDWEEDNIPSDKFSSLQLIDVVLRPGVTDVTAEQVIRAAKVLDITSIEKAATGHRLIVYSQHLLENHSLQLLAEKLLSNNVIQQYNLGRIKKGASVFAETDNSADLSSAPVKVSGLTPEQLLSLSKERRAALDVAEMLALQQYFQKENRDPTEIEFEMIAQTWSEHCSHKTFKADITWHDSDKKSIHGLLNTYIRKATEEINAPWVCSAFIDNAGIIDFDEDYQISFKVETHNHPSAIEPFGGANTGLGGVIRDILGVSGKPVAATDIFCFGPLDSAPENLPEGTLHPRLISSGVVAGVQDYGNKTGIPTVNGAIWYDDAYIANPLVFCGCVGLAPKNKHPRAPQKGDRIIVLGGRTGRDGLRGATFSSMTMDAVTGEVAGASVQIGDPIIARGLIEVVTRARDESLYHAITDCGAGGLSSAVGEMASDTGADVELSEIKLKYPGLAPWEIWLSEAQERMVLAVPPQSLASLQAICNIYDLELTDIGEFTHTHRLKVSYHQKIILDLSNDFLHEGMPRKKLLASSTPPVRKTVRDKTASLLNLDYAGMLLKLLSHPNIASKQQIIRRYDHEVQGGTVVKPLTGANNDGPSDACVLKPAGTAGLRGIVLSNGLNPELGKHDPYAMAVSVIDEAIRNAVAVGADPARIAILDNFCWGDPARPETLGTLAETCRGCYDAALHYQTPFISGKDSLNNEYMSTDGKRHAIPGTLLISAIGIIEDVTTAVTMDFKSPGNSIYLLGETKDHFAGSHFRKLGGFSGSCEEDNSPELPAYTPMLYNALHQAIQKKLIRACHDLSEGGLAAAAAEMCIGGRLGCQLTFEKTTDPVCMLFSESNGRLLVEVAPEHCDKFEACFYPELKSYVTLLGRVTETQTLEIAQAETPLLSLPVNQLTASFFPSE
jgi:phosphoribosylformylglycinamidine synthase II